MPEYTANINYYIRFSAKDDEQAKQIAHREAYIRPEGELANLHNDTIKEEVE